MKNVRGLERSRVCKKVREILTLLRYKEKGLSAHALSSYAATVQAKEETGEGEGDISSRIVAIKNKIFDLKNKAVFVVILTFLRRQKQKV